MSHGHELDPLCSGRGLLGRAGDVAAAAWGIVERAGLADALDPARRRVVAAFAPRFPTAARRGESNDAWIAAAEARGKVLDVMGHTHREELVEWRPGHVYLNPGCCCEAGRITFGLVDGRNVLAHGADGLGRKGMRALVLREIVSVERPGGVAQCVLLANERWLPVDSASNDARRDRAAGLRVGQVALLESAGGAGAVLALFRKLRARFAAFGLDVVYVAVDPDDSALYGRMLFEPTGSECRGWDFADYAPVTVMRLDLRDVRSRMTPALKRRFGDSSAGDAQQIDGG